MHPSFIHKKKPDSGVWLAKYESEFYRLKKRKRQMYEGNYELKENLRYLIWSPYAKVYYERRVNPLQDSEDNIQYYIKKGYLYIWPDEDNQQEIREDVKNEKLGYWDLMFRRQTEIDFDRQRRGKKTGINDQWLRKHRRELIDKLKVKYKRKS